MSHRFIEGYARLGVCLADGRWDEIDGVGMSEVVYVVDLERDGRYEIVFSASKGASAAAYYFATVRRGRLRVVTRPGGRSFELLDAYEFSPRSWLSWGCARALDGTGLLVQVRVWRTPDGLEWVRKTFQLIGSSVELALVEPGEGEGPPWMLADTVSPPCRLIEPQGT